MCSFYVDFDEAPAIGGQQAFFFTGDKVDPRRLVGGRIAGFRFDDGNRLIFTVILPPQPMSDWESIEIDDGPNHTPPAASH
ncbi:MAG: hypothetical protein ABS79_06995 [Planctomycetes bacterium SCN 63-9]|nr:MAG: hypothetical protein ABS79_06995 [Planctomycetes bacterium SCN 63-9]